MKQAASFLSVHGRTGFIVWLPSLVTQVAGPFHCDPRRLPICRLNWMEWGGQRLGVCQWNHLGSQTRSNQSLPRQGKGAILLAGRHSEAANPPTELPVLAWFHEGYNTAFSSTNSAQWVSGTKGWFLPAGQPHLTSPLCPSSRAAREGRACTAT